MKENLFINSLFDSQLSGNLFQDVAVIGMSGRFPGVSTIDGLWGGIIDGTLMGPADIQTRAQSGDSKIGDQAQQFDAGLFGLTEEQALSLNGAERVFLEITWEALEISGQMPSRLNSKIGLFVAQPDHSAGGESIAKVTSEVLNQLGASVVLFFASSNSVDAIANAVESIRSGKCNTALVGGVSYVPSDGIAEHPNCEDAVVIVLKNWEETKKDADPIFAVIKEVAVNDLSNADARHQNTPYTKSISYIEHCGSDLFSDSTKAIDKLISGLGYGEKKEGCALGVNLESDSMSCIAGVLKASLALSHKQLPTCHINTDVDLGNTPFFTVSSPREWTCEGPRKAGVHSSAGLIVLEEFENKKVVPSAGRAIQLFCWSANSGASREAYARKLAEYLVENKNANLADIAWNLQYFRAPFAERRFAVAGSETELQSALSGETHLNQHQNSIEDPLTEVVFMFPGQGAQFLTMGKELYEHEPVFREAVSECAVLLEAITGEDIREVIYPAQLGGVAAEKLNNTYYTQPAIFVIEYALAKLWISWGIEPAALIGHSIGEYVAAHLAGVFSLDDGLLLIANRSRLMAALEHGSMLAVHSNYEHITSLMPVTLSLSAINSPKECVVAGPSGEINDFSKLLEEKAIQFHPLRTSHAFHSTMMDPIVAAFEEVMHSVTLCEPGIPLISTVTGTWMTDEEATSPAYWAKHMRATVRFADGINTLVQDSFNLMLETGPGNVNASLVMQNTLGQHVVSLSSLLANNGKSAYYSVLEAAGGLWLNGIDLNWDAFYEGQHRVRLSNLPTYAFDRKREDMVVMHDTLPLESKENNELEVPEADTSIDEVAKKLDHHTSPAEPKIHQSEDVQEPFSGIEFTTRYHEKTRTSRAHCRETDQPSSDLENGFSYPIIIEKSNGCKVWDVDNNEYIDVNDSYGSGLLGHHNDVVAAALHEQVDLGWVSNGQDKSVQELRDLLQSLLNCEAVVLRNSESEALHDAIQIARKSTGRPWVATFNDLYHSGAIESGNNLVLEVGLADSLKTIKTKANQIAAIVVNPVSASFCGEFLRQVYEVAREYDIILIFDQVKTGLSHREFSMQSDLSVYGASIASGISFGVISGSEKHLSTKGKISTAQPLALVAARSTIKNLSGNRGELLRDLENQAAKLSNSLNEVCQENQLPVEVVHFGNVWEIRCKASMSCSEELFALMRFNGVNIFAGRPCFLNFGFNSEDVDRINQTFIACIQELTLGGCFSQRVEEDVEITQEFAETDAAGKIEVEQPVVSNDADEGKDEGLSRFVPGKMKRLFGRFLK